MKIRTGFVTNSSSYSSAEIVIDNPVLLEILKKYRELSIFEYDVEIGDVFEINRDEDGDFAYDCPHSIKDLILCFVNMIFELDNMNGGGDRQRLYDLNSEIENNIEIINNGYRYVRWYFQCDNYGEFSEPSGGCLFEYNGEDERYDEWDGEF